MRVETVDWLLFNYPEFYIRAREVSKESKGMSEYLPNFNQPRSPIENIVVTRAVMQEVAELIELSVSGLSDYQKDIVRVKYGWTLSERKLIVSIPVVTSKVHKILCEQGYGWSEIKFYEDLRKARTHVGNMMSRLSSNTLRELSVVMPREKGLSSSQLERIYAYVYKMSYKCT